MDSKYVITLKEKFNTVNKFFLMDSINILRRELNIPFDTVLEMSDHLPITLYHNKNKELTKKMFTKLKRAVAFRITMKKE